MQKAQFSGGSLLGNSKEFYMLAALREMKLTDQPLKKKKRHLSQYRKTGVSFVGSKQCGVCFHAHLGGESSVTLPHPVPPMMTLNLK